MADAGNDLRIAPNGNSFMGNVITILFAIVFTAP
jgi:hypothetical protein